MAAIDKPPPLKADNEHHSLLEAPSIAYSSATVRRAFAVWMYCGQINEFQHVCNYYHYLEALEDKLPEESRAASRQQELDLFTGRPPLSSYVVDNFPTLYPAATRQVMLRRTQETNRHKTVQKENTKEPHEIPGAGTSKAEILEASVMIRDYCKRSMKSSKMFLKEFREHTQRCGLANTVGNVAFYIKRKIITSEIQLEANYAQTLKLLARSYEGNEDVELSIEAQDDFIPLILKKTNSLHTDTTNNKQRTSDSRYKCGDIVGAKTRDVRIERMYKFDKNKYKKKIKSKDCALVQGRIC